MTAGRTFIETAGRKNPISRRRILVALGVASGGIAFADLLSGARPAQAAKTIAGKANAVFSGSTLFYFNRDRTTATPWLVPSALLVEAVPDHISGARVTVTWDTRLVELASSTVVIASLSGLTAVPCGSSNAGHAGSLSFTWPDSLDAGNTKLTFHCVLPLTARRLHLSDALEKAMLSSAVVDFKDGSEPIAVAAAPTQRPIKGQAWGAEVAVLWGANDPGTEAGNASFAKVVRIESIGPGSIPAGSFVTLSADAGVVRALDVESVCFSGDQSKPVDATFKVSNKGTSRLVEVIIHEAVAAGQHIRVSVAGDSDATANAQDGDPAALVTFGAPHDKNKALQRQTGTESIALVHHSPSQGK